MQMPTLLTLNGGSLLKYSKRKQKTGRAKILRLQSWCDLETKLDDFGAPPQPNNAPVARPLRENRLNTPRTQWSSPKSHNLLGRPTRTRAIVVQVRSPILPRRARRARSVGGRVAANVRGRKTIDRLPSSNPSSPPPPPNKPRPCRQAC